MPTIRQISEQKELQFDINRSIEWFGSNKLNFSFDELSFFEFSYKNTYDSSPELFPNGMTIKIKKANWKAWINVYVKHDLKLSPRYDQKESISEIE